ncbi:glycoside hydrolase family 73 protein [Ligilactobacillus apodemi]|uniref:glycoside hydrolase family 73 protein n=1 Tax=Ligilactobacillus apodemi TaxID=307126 RepID=UPI00046902FF|nr:glycoside hydrolase family 73 protein [Ligilactobacillus apodemi]MBD5069739.1 glycoside hydrolase family 73 protein [Lactobacillus sp.]MCR1901537.1 glycoside hydrolase family 73 protein [Ligilactobacillus apodemi]
MGRRKKKKNYPQLVLLGFTVLFLGTFATGIADKYSSSQATSQPTTDSETQTKQSFIKKLVPVAQAEQRQYGVFTSITLAQAALESDWGQSELSAKYNNLFGIKSSTGSLMTTQEYVNGEWVTIKDTFAVYNSWDDSVKAHTQLFVNGTAWNSDHYGSVLRATSYEQAAQALQQQGYATDPDYAQKLISLIKEYNLHQYDL